MLCLIEVPRFTCCLIGLAHQIGVRTNLPRLAHDTQFRDVALWDRDLAVWIEPLGKNIVHIVGVFDKATTAHKKLARHSRIEIVPAEHVVHLHCLQREREVLPCHRFVTDVQGIPRAVADHAGFGVVEQRQGIDLGLDEGLLPRIAVQTVVSDPRREVVVAG